MSDQTEEELDKTIPQDRMMVIEKRFGYRYLSLFRMGLWLLCFFIVGALVGHYFKPPPSKDDVNPVPMLEQQVKALELKNRELEQDLIDVRVTASIDKNATTMVQDSLADLQQTIAEQRKAISFYKGMMSPSDLQKGVSVRSIEWKSSNIERVFTFDLVVQQIARRHGLVKGKVLIELEGLSEGKTLSYAINKLSDQIKKPEIALKFKYFQEVQGEIKLPENFIPQRVLLKLSTKIAGQKTVTEEKNLPWRPM